MLNDESIVLNSSLNSFTSNNEKDLIKSKNDKQTSVSVCSIILLIFLLNFFLANKCFKQ